LAEGEGGKVNLPDLGILALVEGVADIMPIDASAHSMLAARLSGWRAGPLAAAIHLGAILALMSYFWREMLSIAQGLWKLRKLRIEAGTRLLAKLCLTAAPLIVARSAILGVSPPKMTDLLTVGIITLVMAIVMLLADRLSLTVKRIEHIGIGTSLAIGLMQMLALVTGVGRVAIGLTTARLFGMEREDGWRFVLLASLPVLIADIVTESAPGLALGRSDLLALLASFLLILLALPIGLSLLRRAGLLPFVLYRLLFGLILVGLGML
jgi:undecaprenyl-diphosphatase